MLICNMGIAKKYFLQNKSTTKYYYSSFILLSIIYFLNLSLYLHNNLSLFGFMLFIIIVNQLISGTMLAFSLLPEPMLIPMCRDEEDSENLYIDDFFWLHERGVDIFFLLLIIHLLRKLYIKALSKEQELAWKSGIVLFLLSHGVIFFGLILCCTHLSEITLTIAANILHTIFFFKGKIYWWLFTDMFLNTDTLLRLSYIHYVLAFFITYYGVTHGIEMHYDWRGELGMLALDAELHWWWEGFLNEIGKFLIDIFYLIFISSFFYEISEALSYEIFMWGDVGILIDIRFYGVAPHWYFRPYMSWLIVCPYHKMGLCGLGFFFLLLYYQPNLNKKLLNINSYYNLIYIQIFFIFYFCIIYTSSFLPYGRFYNQIGGNIAMLQSYLLIFIYIGSKNKSFNLTTIAKLILI